MITPMSARVAYDDERGQRTGYQQDRLLFHGGSVSDLKAAFRDAVDDSSEHCAETGSSPKRPIPANSPCASLRRSKKTRQRERRCNVAEVGQEAPCRPHPSQDNDCRQLRFRPETIFRSAIFSKTPRPSMVY